MKKILLVLALSFSMSIILTAQNSEDALRYSSYSNTGSARFIGLSGAMGSIGGDLTSLNYNPAGLGIYKSSEYVFAPRYLYNKAEANYGGFNSSDTRHNLNFGMIGMVTTMSLMDKGRANASGWKYVQFGFSVNRVDNYRSDITITGDSYGGSKVDQWQAEAQDLYPDELNIFGSNLAWETYLLDTLNGYPNDYVTAVPLGGVNQLYTKQSEGYKNEMSFAFSGNYNDRLFIGASFAFSFLKYNSQISLTETALESDIQAYEFETFEYYEELTTNGNGFNAKFGAIYMLSPTIRLNAAFHSPTWFYKMTDFYYSRVDTKLGDGESYYKSSPNGSYDYRMNTPLRAMGGVSVFIGNMGFVSADYEYMDYGMAGFNDENNTFGDVNQEIENIFTATHSLRVGGELRLQPFFLRGGYGIRTSAIDTDVNEILSSQYSFGLGYRSGPFVFDFAYMTEMNSHNYYMYDSDFVNPAFMETQRNTFSASIGFKF